MENKRMKALAMFAVAAMLAVSAVPISGGDADASSDYWTYTVSLNSDGSVTVTGSGSAVASPAAAGAVGTTGAYTSASGSNVGSWGFDDKGYGPFGSFYAAYDASNGNKMICILNPNDLDKSIDGTIMLSTDYSSSVVNIMWVLPTVYWNVDSDGKLILSNDSSKGIAYAHTIDGEEYDYMAIGVYEASKLNNGSKDILTSSTGQKPLYSQSRAQMRTLAEAQGIATVNGTESNGHAMLWNFYMWQLYRFSVITVGGGMNSQAIFGNGDVFGGHYGTNANATGDLDTSGPYAGYVANPDSPGATGTHDQSVKAFIEDAWGSLYEFVDGVLIYTVGDKISMFASQSSSPTNLADDYPTDPIGILPVGDTYGIASTSSDYSVFWGLPSSTVVDIASSTMFDNLFAYSGNSSSNPSGLIVGGYSGDLSEHAPYCGLSCMDALSDVGSSARVGGRLAFVYSDADSASPETTHTITYTLDSTTTYKTVGVADGGSISAPDAPTKMNKVFGGWYTDADCTQQYVFGSPVTKDLMLYAKWYSGPVFDKMPSAAGIFAYVATSENT